MWSKTDHMQLFTWMLGGHVEKWHILYSCEVAFWTQEMSPKLPDCPVWTLSRCMVCGCVQ